MTTLFDDGGVDAAINRVLEAEGAAREAVQGCRSHALTMLHEARARTHRTGRRLDRHIRRMHRLCDAAIVREQATLTRQAAALTMPQTCPPVLQQRLDAALERLLDELTSSTGAPCGRIADNASGHPWSAWCG